MWRIWGTSLWLHRTSFISLRNQILFPCTIHTIQLFFTYSQIVDPAWEVNHQQSHYHSVCCYIFLFRNWYCACLWLFKPFVELSFNDGNEVLSHNFSGACYTFRTKNSCNWNWIRLETRPLQCVFSPVPTIPKCKLVIIHFHFVSSWRQWWHG